MTAGVATEVDIEDWAGLTSWFSRTHEIGVHLQCKGFCTVKNAFSKRLPARAEREARELKNMGALTRTPLQAVDCFLGETASCWTMQLGASSTSEPSTEPFLDQVAEHLGEIGMHVAACSESFLGLSLNERGPGILHYSKSSNEGDAPSVFDLQEASEYMARAVQKKAVLLYSVGPNSATLHLTPLQDEKRVYTSAIDPGVVLIYRSDVCYARVDAERTCIFVEVDFRPSTHRLLGEGHADKHTDTVPPALQDLYSHFLHEMIEFGSDFEDIDHDLLRLAFFSHPKASSAPVRIIAIHAQLPTNVINGHDCPFAGTLVGGQDCITEIRPTETGETERYDHALFGTAKWDNTPYYEEDWQANGEFKMYTKHMGALTTCDVDYDLNEFNITASEAQCMDPRGRLLFYSAIGALRKTRTQILQKRTIENRNRFGTALLSTSNRYDLRGTNAGFFAGISAGERYSDFVCKGSKMSQCAWVNMSLSSMVSLLSYAFETGGPAMVIDIGDSSSLAAVETAVDNLRCRKSDPLAVASGVNTYSSPFTLVALCYAGQLAKTGRSRVFDESCDGYSISDASISTVLDMEERRVEQIQIDMEEDVYGLITGVSLKSRGSAASLTAPNAAAIREVMMSASKTEAGIDYDTVDAVEVNSGGSRMSDVIEACITVRATNASAKKASAVPLRPAKSNLGNCGPVSGLASFARAVIMINKQLHGPTIHLHQMLELPEDAGGMTTRQLFLTETIEALGTTQAIGVNNFSIHGSNVSLIMQGDRNFGKVEPKETKPIHWWPAGDPKKGLNMLHGPYVIGSWSNWQYVEEMDVEENGLVWGYTVILGENKFENFQIWIDQDQDQILHPARPQEGKHAEVIGPESDVSKELSWQIDGRAERVRLINEIQMESLEKASEQDSEDDLRYVVAYRGSSLPPGQDSDKVGRMPTVVMDPEDAGSPGDKYRIRLRSRGKYRTVTWSKITDAEAVELEQLYGRDVERPERYVHTYQIIGDHNQWTFEDMQPDKDQQGAFIAKLHLLKEESNFQIYRDGDWEQGFYPKKAKGDATDEVRGPDGNGYGKNWQVRGNVGDLVQVKFERRVVDGKELRSVSWECVGHEDVDFVKLAKSHKYFFIGSTSNFEKTLEMIKDEETGNYSLEIWAGSEGMVEFQILLNSNAMAAVHPSVNKATMFDDEHQVQGPDDGGVDKYWAIGLHPRDPITKGKRVLVHLDMEDGLPRKVWWEHVASAAAHREYVAQGLLNTFERHCRLHGIQTWESEERPGRLITTPSYMVACVKKFHMVVSETEQMQIADAAAAETQLL